jgi:hypothetical protein
VHKLDTFTDPQRAAQQHVRSLIWQFYADPKDYRTTPTPWQRAQLRARFDYIFCRYTGFVSLDRLLPRLHANKAELLAVLDHPDISVAQLGCEADQRFGERHPLPGDKTQSERRHRSDVGRDRRDAFLGLAKTRPKLGVAFWDHLGSRLAIPAQPTVPRLNEFIRRRGHPA